VSSASQGCAALHNTLLARIGDTVHRENHVEITRQQRRDTVIQADTVAALDRQFDLVAVRRDRPPQHRIILDQHIPPQCLRIGLIGALFERGKPAAAVEIGHGMQDRMPETGRIADPRLTPHQHPIDLILDPTRRPENQVGFGAGGALRPGVLCAPVRVIDLDRMGRIGQFARDLGTVGGRDAGVGVDVQVKIGARVPAAAGQRSGQRHSDHLRKLRETIRDTLNGLDGVIGAHACWCASTASATAPNTPA
jgi:hypothetical protein